MVTVRIAGAGFGWFRAAGGLVIACAFWAGLLLTSCERPGPPVAASPEPTTGAVEPEASARPPARPLFFWSTKMGASEVHLLGSIHVARADLYPLDSTIEGEFERSQVLALELSLDDRSKLEASERMLRLARLAPGQRLRDVLPPATWELLQRRLVERGESSLGLRGFRPWFVSMALSMRVMQEAGYSAEHGIDAYFHRRAEGNKRIEALETIDEQLAVFEGLPQELDTRMLHETLESFEELPSELALGFSAWSAGDAQALDAAMLRGMRSEQPELYARAFVRRNQTMVDALYRLTREPAIYFVVVGAGHLAGNDGIVELLRARGLAVEHRSAALPATSGSTP